MLEVTPREAISITQTQAKQLMFALYQTLRLHVESAKYANVLGQNSELQNRWLTIQSNIVTGSNVSNSRLEQELQEFLRNHAQQSKSRLLRSGKLDFDSVKQFRMHDRRVMAAKGLN